MLADRNNEIFGDFYGLTTIKLNSHTSGNSWTELNETDAPNKWRYFNVLIITSTV